MQTTQGVDPECCLAELDLRVIREARLQASTLAAVRKLKSLLYKAYWFYLQEKTVCFQTPCIVMRRDWDV